MTHSLRARTTWLVVVVIAILMLPLVVLSYFKAIEEVDELGDARLSQNARTIDALAQDVGFGDAPADRPIEVTAWHHGRGEDEVGVGGHGYETQIGFEYWDAQNRLRMTTRNLRDLAFDGAPLGFADVQLNGRHWRTFTLETPAGAHARVAERYDSRREIARELAIQNAVPVLIGLPLLALLANFAVRRGLRPLDSLAALLATRRADAIDPIQVDDPPREIEPIVQSLDDLLERLRAMLEHERQFTSNAAHELRTPLAGALLHVENARAAATAEAREQALDQAHQGLRRLARLVSQMLELARWEATASTHDMRAVDLDECVDAAIAELTNTASDKDLEIVVRKGPEAHRIRGWEPGVRAVLRNLLDNAVRYSFERGRVEIAVARDDDGVRLTVSDTGPGIAEPQRASMFERFRRGADGAGEGSGLGLSIVARIVELHDARIDVREPADGTGLRIDIWFPPSA